MSSSRFPPGAERSQDSRAYTPTPWPSPHTSQSSSSSYARSSEHDTSSDDSVDRSLQVAVDSSPHYPPPPAPSTASTINESLLITSGTGTLDEPRTSVLVSSTSSQTPITPSIVYEAASIPLPASPPITFTHCNECETNDSDYISCSHPEDANIFSVASVNSSHLSQNPVFSQPPVSAVLTTPSGMLRSRALAALFDENLDDTAKSIFLNTVGGNLIAKDKTISNAKAVRASTLGALTWRLNVALLSGEDLTEATLGKALPVLKKTIKNDGKTLGSLVLDSEGELLAIAYVREKLMVGMFGEGVEGKEEEEGEREEDGAGEAVVAQVALTTKLLAMVEYLVEELKDFKMPAGME